MAEHPNIEVFKHVYDAFTTGDMDRLAELIAPDVVWHVPGTNLISGEYTSRGHLRLFQQDLRAVPGHLPPQAP